MDTEAIGEWTADVSRHPKDVLEILERHNKVLNPSANHSLRQAIRH